MSVFPWRVTSVFHSASYTDTCWYGVFSKGEIFWCSMYFLLSLQSTSSLNFGLNKSSIDFSWKLFEIFKLNKILQKVYMYRNSWFKSKLICDMWILKKGKHNMWIYEALWSLICLLKCTWPTHFLFHLVNTSRFPCQEPCTWKEGFEISLLNFWCM